MKVVERAIRLGCCLWWLTSLGSAKPALEPVATSEYDTEILHVSWRASPACGDARTVATLVQQLLGDHSAPQRNATAKFDVTAVRRGYRVVLAFSDGTRVGRRSLDVESCEAVMDASTLVLAVALQPNMRWDAALARLAELRSLASELPSSRAIAVLPDIEPAVVEPAPTPPIRPIVTLVPTESPKLSPTRSDAKLKERPRKRLERSPPSRLSPVRVAVSFLLDTATLPTWSGGFKASVGLDFAPVFVEMAGLMLLPRDVSLPGDSKRGATVQLKGGEVRLCSASRPPNTTFSARPCAGALLAAISGDAFGFRDRHRVETYFATTLGGDAALRLRRDVSFVGGFAAVVPLRRVAVVVNGVDTPLHRTPTALQLWLGVDWAI